MFSPSTSSSLCAYGYRVRYLLRYTKSSQNPQLLRMSPKNFGYPSGWISRRVIYRNPTDAYYDISQLMYIFLVVLSFITLAISYFACTCLYLRKSFDICWKQIQYITLILQKLPLHYSYEQQD